MRLINVISFVLTEFVGDDVPEYAILSHTWNEDEVTFQDLQEYNRTRAACGGGMEGLRKAGFKKIQYACTQARCDELDWCWVDTCCIDKTSSSELSEAINSMFKWYQRAYTCYAYLADVPSPAKEDPFPVGSSFRRSRWFTRGWTLQELVAPSVVHFYSRDWARIGAKQPDGGMDDASDDEESGPSARATQGLVGQRMMSLLQDVTRVPVDILSCKSEVHEYSVAQRMSWAATRTCTREEDLAYCLMGLFDINMPLLYGEGAKAFSRLQEEIIRSIDDHSLLAWTVAPNDLRAWCIGSVLARSPADFAASANIVSTGEELGELSSLTKQGLRMHAQRAELELVEGDLPTWNFAAASLYSLVLNCRVKHGAVRRIGLLLLRDHTAVGDRRHLRLCTPYHIGLPGHPTAELDGYETIYIRQQRNRTIPRLLGVTGINALSLENVSLSLWRKQLEMSSEDGQRHERASAEQPFRPIEGDNLHYQPPGRVRWFAPGEHEAVALIASPHTFYLCPGNPIDLIANPGRVTVFWIDRCLASKTVSAADSRLGPVPAFALAFGFSGSDPDENKSESVFIRLFQKPLQLEDAWSHYFRAEVGWASLRDGVEVYTTLRLNDDAVTVVAGLRREPRSSHPMGIGACYVVRLGRVLQPGEGAQIVAD